MKLWDDERLPPINTVSIHGLLLYIVHYTENNNLLLLSIPCTLSTSLRMEFLVDVLTSRANECFDNIPEDLQYMIKELGRI